MVVSGAATLGIRLAAVARPAYITAGARLVQVVGEVSVLRRPLATVKIHPDSAHGFLFRHDAECARDVEVFLAA